jgi:hypothetical protein
MDCQNRRLALLPISGVLFTFPWIFMEALLNFYLFPLFYFFGAYFVFVNFPQIGEALHSKPVYIEDLILTTLKTSDETFKTIYITIMNVILSGLFAFFAEYVMLQGIREKPMIELLAIIGGNLSLYMRTQDVVGNLLLNLCHCLKDRERVRRQSAVELMENQRVERRKRKNSDDVDDEI